MPISLTEDDILVLNKILVLQRGGSYRPGAWSSNTHYNDIVYDQNGWVGLGNSHIYGDATIDVQLKSIQAISEAVANANLSLGTNLTDFDTAYIMAIARVESGFNPLAAAGTTSATGLGQFIDATGATYGLNATNRWDVNAQAAALVAEYIDLKNQVIARGQSLDYIYAYHHDGMNASNPSIGLSISNSQVMPKIVDFQLFILAPIFPSDLPSHLTPLLYEPPTDSPLYGPYNNGITPMWLAPAVSPYMQAPIVSSPLVLDLDGDGVEVSKLGYDTAASTTYFDINNDGFAERTAWAQGGDGILAIDRNGNGKIDNQSELFGNNSTYANGFLNLKQYDSNNDNKITSVDTQFANLRVWVDVNSNGITDSGELKTLSSMNITQINLASTALANTYLNENKVSDTSTFTMNGTTKTISDVWFRNDTVSTHYQGDVTLDVKTLFLPALKGFGQLKDLHVAMSQNTSLLTLVENFAS